MKNNEWETEVGMNVNKNVTKRIFVFCHIKMKQSQEKTETQKKLNKWFVEMDLNFKCD